MPLFASATANAAQTICDFRFSVSRMKNPAASSGVSKELYNNFPQSCHLGMFLSWFDYAHHDPEPGRMDRGSSPRFAGFHFDKLSVASPVEPPLKACGNDGP